MKEIIMNFTPKSLARMNSRCLLLETFGFEIDHEDSRVSLGELEFDFSATELTHRNILNAVIQQSLKAGRISGRNELRNEIQNTLTMEYV
jgi:hypothetical protein